MTWSAGKWWRRASAALKDKRSVYLCRVAASGQRAEIEAAVIRATSHDERSIDYKNAARVFAWARTSSSCLAPLMRALARRASRTRSWAVALKTLLLFHGVLICSSSANRLGRLPFDLSDFLDCSACPSTSHGFSSFVRAYFQYLDHRSIFLSSAISQSYNNDSSSSSKLLSPVSSYPQLDMLAKLQDLLELLMQIQPYADGMEVGLILEAMDCVIIEIFEIYSEICRGIASFLADALGPNSSSCPTSTPSKTKTGFTAEEWKRAGLAGMRILRRAVEQSKQLSSYFGLCRSLGVLNAAVVPPIQTIPEGDIRDLEDLVLGDAPALTKNYCKDEVEKRSRADKGSEIVVTEEWEVFEDEMSTPPGNSNENPFFCLEDGYKYALTRQSCRPVAGGNLIELI
ncbi:putative clathrin assembly protein [Platanthera zijinensis]|uniref:Clathrin assembly protein n=1 Tax=Platanthera zijinensis TaxID=2320716 RepID=A0AAP0GB71_9ASPA